VEKDNQSKNLDELYDVMNPIEIREIEQELNQYLVKYPDEQKIDATIDTLRQYVPSQHKQSTKNNERLFKLIQRSVTEITLISKTYWIVSATLFILGYFITRYAAYNPLFTLVIIAPFPFAFGLVEVFKGREKGLLEIEMACKLSAHEIMLSRLLIIGVYNIVLNTFLTFSFVSLINTASMLQILFAWMTPLTFFAALSLWLSMKFRGPIFMTIIVSLWMVFSFLFISKPNWLDFILSLNVAMYMLFLGIGISLFILQIKQLIDKYASFEGGGTFETGY